LAILFNKKITDEWLNMGFLGEKNAEVTNSVKK